MSEERLDEKSLYIPYDFYEDRRIRFKKRLDAMLEFAFSETDCRNNQLLKYFGQPTGKPCGLCDVCKSRLDSPVTDKRLAEIKKDIIMLLKKNPQYLGEIQLTLEIKEDIVNSIVKDLLTREEVLYLDDGRLALHRRYITSFLIGSILRKVLLCTELKILSLIMQKQLYRFS